jgi:nicotinamidase/pyrazinamidase
MKVLILVDIQNDFCPGGALAVTDGDQVVSVANQLIKSGKFDLIVATKDWHPINHNSFGNPWPIHCVQNTWGAELRGDLEINRIDQLVHKGADKNHDSYSGFFDNDKLAETELRGLIMSHANRLSETLEDIELTICGLALDYCVAATAKDARQLGFKTEIVLDACRSVNVNVGDDLLVLRELQQVGVDVVESRQILELAQPLNFIKHISVNNLSA